MSRLLLLFFVTILSLLNKVSSVLPHLEYTVEDFDGFLEYDYSKKFESGNLLITDPNSWQPYQIFEFTTDGDNIRNYSTVINGTDTTVIPIDLGFLDSYTLLILDLEKGVFFSDDKGEIKGIWNGLNSNSEKLGCDLEKLSVDQVNSRIYITSKNVQCNYQAQVGVFVFDWKGNLLLTLTNPGFNQTLGIAGDSSGNIWIPDINDIFVYNYESKKYQTYNPLDSPDRMAYNGILITDDDKIYVAVPSFYHDLVIELDTYGNIKQKIQLSGNTSTDGKTSGMPGTMVMIGDTLVVEVPYATKHEAPGDEDVIQFYNTDGGSYSYAFGGHSCKSKNILCVPYNGMVVVP